MARKRYKPEEIVNLLRQAEVLHGQGLSMADAIRQLGISEVTFYRWRKEYAGMSGDQLRRLKELEKENERLRRAVSDLTLDKQILKEAAGGNFSSVRLRSGGSARCTVYVSLSWTTMFMESGIVMSNFPLVVAFGSASSCCLNSVSSADSSTVCYSFSQPLLTAIPLTLRVLRDRVRVGADRRRLGAEPGGGGHGAVQRRLLRCRGRRGRWGVRDRGRPRAGSRAHDQRIRRRTKDRVIAGM